MIEGLAFEDPILAIDPGSHVTGWAYLAGEDCRTGHITFTKDMTLSHKLRMYRYCLQTWVKRQPAVIVIERPIIGSGKKTRGAAAQILMQMSGVAEEALHDYTGLGPLWMAASTWKAEIAGRGDLTTLEKRSGFVIRKLAKLGFPKVDHIDEADALAIGLCFRKEHFGRLHADQA